MRKLAICSIFMLNVVSSVMMFNASEVETSSGKDTKVYHTYWEDCPKTSGYCGDWYVGDGAYGNYSIFRANYHGKSGYGSQASIRDKDGDLHRKHDASKTASSEAKVHTSESAKSFYYAYYS